MLITVIKEIVPFVTLFWLFIMTFASAMQILGLKLDPALEDGQTEISAEDSENPYYGLGVF